MKAIISNEKQVTWMEPDSDGPYQVTHTCGDITHTCCGMVERTVKTYYIGEGDGSTCANCGKDIEYTRRKSNTNCWSCGRKETNSVAHIGCPYHCPACGRAPVEQVQAYVERSKHKVPESEPCYNCDGTGIYAPRGDYLGGCNYCNGTGVKQKYAEQPLSLDLATTPSGDTRSIHQC